MKNFLTISILVWALSYNAFAGSRVDSIVSEDAKNRLDKIEQITNTIKELEVNQKKLQKDLKAALAKEEKRQFYLNVAGISGNIAAITAFGTGGYVAFEGLATFLGVLDAGLFGGQVYEPNIKKKVIIAGTVVVVSAVVASGSLVGFYVNRNDAEKILAALPKLQLRIAQTQLELAKEVKQLCKTEPNHSLCD